MKGLARLSKDGGETVVLRRLDLPTVMNDTPRHLLSVAVVDCETTGLDPAVDEVIEIAVARALFCAETGKLYDIDAEYEGQQQQSRPLSEHITDLTGLTDEALAGKSIDWHRVDNLLAKSDLVVAHNAGFDCKFIDRETENRLAKLVWGCSQRQVDWLEAVGCRSARLETLMAWAGYFYEAHRAMADVYALVELLNVTGTMPELYRRATTASFDVVAVASPFESKDVLKANGYRWSPEVRVWKKAVDTRNEAVDEIEWLGGNVYGQDVHPGRIDVVKPSERFHR